MAEHPAVVFLEQALDRAEAAARGLPPGPWRWVEVDDGSEREVLAGADGQAVLSSGDAESYQSLVWKHAGFEAFLSLMQPTAVLARVAADRQILAEHAKAPMAACAACADTRHPDPRQWALVVWPCRTVLLLAAGWGWTEET